MYRLNILNKLETLLIKRISIINKYINKYIYMIITISSVFDEIISNSSGVRHVSI